MKFQYYYNENIRQICHDIKQYDDMKRHNYAVKTMVSYFLSLQCITSNAYLIPAPQHTGKAIYTRELCILLATYTGACVCDILTCKPHIPLYKQKLNNETNITNKQITNQTNNEVQLELQLTGKFPTIADGSPVFFVDNVIGTGKTFLTAKKLIQNNIQPLVYAVDFTRISNEMREYIKMLNKIQN